MGRLKFMKDLKEKLEQEKLEQEKRNQLIKATKEFLNYSEEVKNCDNCRHCKERDGFVDRTWYKVCTWNPLLEFSVNPRGSCNKFEEEKLD